MSTDRPRNTRPAFARKDGPPRARPSSGPRREGNFAPRREGGFSPRPSGGGSAPRREGGFSPRPSGGGFAPRSRDGAPPRREGGFAPRREGGFSPRPSGGGFAPRREGGFTPRPREGGFAPRSRDGAPPRREGGFTPRPREGGFTPRPREGGFAPRSRDGAPPRREGGFTPRPSGGGFAPRREGGFAPRPRDGAPPRREGGFTPRPREGGFAPRSRDGAPPRREGGFAPRREGGFSPRPSGGGFAPRREGGFTPRPREGGFAPRSRDGAPPRREGGFAPRREGGFSPRPSGGGFAPRREGGFTPRPREGGFRPRPEGSAPREEGSPYDREDGQRFAVNRSRPSYDSARRPGGRGARPGTGRPAGGREPQLRGPGSFAAGTRPQQYNRYRRDGTVSTPPWKSRRPEDGETPHGRTSRIESRTREFDEREPLPADPREAALRILHAADTRSMFSDRLLDGAHAQGGDPRDLALLHELVKGSLRWRGRIDWMLDKRLHMGLQSTMPWIRNILRLGAYQLQFLDRVPQHAAVDESVKLAHKYTHPAAAGMVNSVLRRIAEDKDRVEWPTGDDSESLSVWGSHPKWIVERWLARFGVEETRALMMAQNRSIPTGLRVNTLRNSREELIETLAKQEVEARVAQRSPDLVWIDGQNAAGRLDAFKDGLCTAQDESEALVCRIVAPEPTDQVLDLCAAPGGKCTHLAELMGDAGEVWALERDGHRVASLEATIARLGMQSIHVVHGDGLDHDFPMPFDRVLVDAPCSGFGVLGRRADARWRKEPTLFEEIPRLQLDLLFAGARRVRPGGVLVYSVCSFEVEETEAIVDKFLEAHPEFTIESVAGLVPDDVVTPEGWMRVLPQRHGCDGAFAARFRRA